MDNKEKKKVLIIPSGTEIAFEIYNALKYSKFIELYGINSIESHADFLFKNNINSFPNCTDNDFIKKLNDVINKLNIDYIFPANDQMLFELVKNKNEIKCEIISSSLKTVEICNSKKKTYDLFKDYDFVPMFYTDINQINCFPVFLKPMVSHSSIGAKIINNKEELLYNYDETRDIVCEYLPGNEITVDCFTNKDGELLVTKPRTRDRIRVGIAVSSHNLPLNEQIAHIASIINDKLSFFGPWFFQLKQDINGNYKLLEIAARVPGTMGLSRNQGINFPLLSIYNSFLNINDKSIIDNKYNIQIDKAFFSRYKIDISYNNVFIDYDDTIIINDKINLIVLSYLYQCKNNNKNIVLITKHIGDLYEDLKKYNISESLFDKIIVLNKSDDKSKYIIGNSIYIDDSFAERKNIFDKCNIPVFDVDMVESLLDWRK